jgi:DNA-binding protein HU-beta
MARKMTKKAAPKKAVAKKSSKKAAPKKAVAKKAAGKPAPAKSIKVTAVPGKTITASALLQAVADRTGMKKSEAKEFVDNYLEVVKAHVLKGVKVKIGDIGMIMIRARKARMGRNPATGAPVKIKASKKLAFRQSATMKQEVMGGR